MYKKTTLKNGLRIITVPRKNTKTVTFLVGVGVGWKYEDKDVNGISHFLEHLFFKGTKKRPGMINVAGPLDEIGGSYNAATSEETTSFYAKVDHKHFDLAADIISDVLINPEFPSREIDKERGVIIEEMNMYEDNPMELPHVEDLWTKLLYGDQPAGRSGFGTKEIISRLKREEFFGYYNKHYTAPNTVVCIAGNFDEKKAIEKVKKYFSAIKTKKPEPKKEVVEKQKTPGLLLDFKKTDQSHIFFGVRGYNLFDLRKYPQLLLATILGGFMSSRLFVSVRVEKGLAYYIRTFSESNTDTGYLATWAGIRNNGIEEALKLILKEYKLLKEKGVSEKELKKAKDNIKGKLTLSLESSDALASFYAGQELLTGKILSLKEKIRQIDKVTPKDVKETAKEMFRPERLNLVLIGPYKDKNKFNKLLKI